MPDAVDEYFASGKWKEEIGSARYESMLAIKKERERAAASQQIVTISKPVEPKKEERPESPRIEVQAQKELPKNQILLGDCLNVIKTIPDNSIDLICTDPPYGYSFMGKDWDKAVPSVEIWKECLRVLKPGAFAFVMSAPRQDVLSQMIVRLSEAGFDTAFTSIYWAYASGMPKAMNISKAIDKKLGATREIIGYAGDGAKRKTSPYNTEHGYNSNSLQPPGNLPVTAPATPQAKALDGAYAGFQPKPAVEVIIVAMKPLSEKNYVNQALAALEKGENGKGVTWLDDGRIPFANNDDKDATITRSSTGYYGDGVYHKDEKYKQEDVTRTDKGRFAANLLVSDDTLNDGKITKSNPHPRTNSPDKANVYGKYNKHTDAGGWSDQGSFSRYFDLDAWAEKTLPFLIVPKANKAEKDKGLNEDSHNSHPTVKPLKLMSYLVTLGSQYNDVILDPFSGSGTTCIAATILGRDYIGIEKNEEYVKIQEARIKAWHDMSNEEIEKFLKVKVKDSDNN